MIQDPRAMLLAIRERPAFLLAMLYHACTPLTQTELENLTGWSYGTVSKSMAALKAHGLAVQGRDRGPWAITNAGSSLFLQNDSSTVEGSSSLGPEGPKGSATYSPSWEHQSHQPPTSPTYLEDLKTRFAQPSTVEGRNGRNPHGLRNRTGQSSTVEGTNGKPSTVEGTNLGANPQPLRNGDGHPPSLPDMAWVNADQRRVQRLAACRLVSINPPALTSIVNDDVLEPIFILAHAWQVEKQNADRKRRGQAELTMGATLYRIKSYHSPSKEAIAYAERQMRLFRQCPSCEHGWFITLNGHMEWVDLDDYQTPCPKCGYGQADEADPDAATDASQPAPGDGAD